MNLSSFYTLSTSLRKGQFYGTLNNAHDIKTKPNGSHMYVEILATW